MASTWKHDAQRAARVGSGLSRERLGAAGSDRARGSRDVNPRGRRGARGWRRADSRGGWRCSRRGRHRHRHPGQSNAECRQVGPPAGRDRHLGGAQGHPLPAGGWGSGDATSRSATMARHRLCGRRRRASHRNRHDLRPQRFRRTGRADELVPRCEPCDHRRDQPRGRDGAFDARLA